MIITMILIFVFGYLCIALEHKLRIDKAAIALPPAIGRHVAHHIGALIALEKGV